MVSCRLTRRRLQRYLDGDVAALLSPEAQWAVARHLDGCSSCVELARQHRFLNGLLRRIGRTFEPDPSSVSRLQELLVHIEQS